MKDMARKLRGEGLTFTEISEKLGVDVRKIRYWTEDIKLSKDQIAEKIRRIKILTSQKKYKETIVDKEALQKSLSQDGLYKTIKMMGLTEGTVRYWCKQYDIDFDFDVKKRPTYETCCICNKKYGIANCKKRICNTCVSKLRRRVSKIKAIGFLGGICEKCGYGITDENFAAFEFHHPDDNKEAAIGTMLNRTWQTIERELDKCELLCSNCHRIIHSDYQNTKLMQEVKEKYKFNNEIGSAKINISYDQDKIVVFGKNDAIIVNEDLKEMVKTMSLDKISKKFGVSVHVIIKICKNKNIEIPDKHFLYRRLDIEKDDLEELIKTKPMTKIGKEFGVSDSAIRKRCRKMGINYKELSPFSQGIVSK